MENVNQAFTTGTWNVKKGKEQEFIHEWNEFAQWSNSVYHGSARLLQDSENPEKFISVGKWSGANAIQEWRERTEFKDAMSRISQLLTEPVQPHTMKEVATVGETVPV